VIAGRDMAPTNGPLASGPAICLNMIVKNDAHTIVELLDSVAPHISSWVIVDTGSDDGTQQLIQRHMAGLGIPGELYQRPWRDTDHNRSEALTLAQGHGDYIWVIGADNLLVGMPDFSSLGASIHWLRCVDGNGETFWQAQLFPDGLQLGHQGGANDYVARDADSRVGVRLDGDYHIESRRLDVVT
jgi:glycosyltransferase involved in cell wall biosynthesis